jgi:hypothetical protein
MNIDDWLRCRSETPSHNHASCRSAISDNHKSECNKEANNCKSNSSAGNIVGRRHLNADINT